MRGRKHVRRPSAYPRVIYGPYGARKTISGPAEWIKGWTTTPQDDTAPVDKTAPIPMTRSEIKAALRAKGAQFDERAADSELYEALVRHG